MSVLRKRPERGAGVSWSAAIKARLPFTAVGVSPLGKLSSPGLRRLTRTRARGGFVLSSCIMNSVGVGDDARSI